MINFIVKELEKLGYYNAKKIMEMCGKACAEFGDLGLAKKIAEGTDDIDGIIARVNDEIAWCGKWNREGCTITAVCTKCGCTLVKRGIVEQKRYILPLL